MIFAFVFRLVRALRVAYAAEAVRGRAALRSTTYGRGPQRAVAHFVEIEGRSLAVSDALRAELSGASSYVI